MLTGLLKHFIWDSEPLYNVYVLLLSILAPFTQPKLGTFNTFKQEDLVQHGPLWFRRAKMGKNLVHLTCAQD